MAPAVNGHSNGSPSALAAKYNLADHFIGGSRLDKAPPSAVKDFVTSHSGHTVITDVSMHLNGKLAEISSADAKILHLDRFSSPTTVLRRSRRFAQYGGGRMRRSKMTTLSSLP